MALNPVDFASNFDLAESLVAAPSRLVDELAAIAKAAAANHPLAASADAGETHQRIADTLKQGGQAAVLIGNIAAAHPDYSILRGLAVAIAQATGAVFGLIPEAANSVGAWLAGAVPHRLPGAKPAQQGGLAMNVMLDGKREAMLLIDFEPDLDTQTPGAMMAALEAADAVVALTAYRTPALEAVADVLLPIAAFTETSGTFVNAQGDRQSFAGVVSPPGEARPGWKVLRVLGNMLDLEGFDHDSSDQVRDEVLAACDEALPAMVIGTGAGERRLNTNGLERIGTIAPYAMDALCRRAEPLQRTADGDVRIRLNAATAQQAGLAGGDNAVLSQGEGRMTLAVVIDPVVPDGCVWTPAGMPGSEVLGAPFGGVRLEKA